MGIKGGEHNKMMESDRIKEGVKNIIWIYAGFLILIAVLYFVYPQTFNFTESLLHYVYLIIDKIWWFAQTIIQQSFTDYSQVYYICGIIIIASTIIKIIYTMLFGKNNPVA